VKQGVLFFAGSVIVSLIAHYLSPLRQIYGIEVTNALIVAAVGAVVLLVGLLIGYLLNRHSRLQESRGSRSLLSPRAVLVLFAIVASEMAVLQLLAGVVSSFFVVELAYYFVLFAGGIVLARWCCTRAYVAPSVAIVVLAVFAGRAFIRFVTSSAINFQFGPERWLFAMQNLSGQVAMLPLDVAVAFTGWYLFSRTRNPVSSDCSRGR
jgi:hypothetical protein